MQALRKIMFATIFAVASTTVTAQSNLENPIGSVINQVFQENNSKFLCLNSESSLKAIRKSVEDYLKNNGKENTTDANEIAKAAYTIFPCPFSPYREELEVATEKEIEGVWLYPETSQKLRYGPKSPKWSRPPGILPTKCESVAYYPGGEARNAQFNGQMACPFVSAKDMDVSRSNPKVVTWKMIKNGTMKMTRTDIENHIEEWEIFYVKKPFDMATVHFNEGDLVEFLRREKGNDFNVATIFRHLHRLK